ncbi:predicted protein [Ostreococcus lucimarinus CCE9901]|uniref:Uncharacterized protein n=1 Tax=Ostreococcus lucimarinus (strain CCE9901) TaxID=436017 RepID=A4S4N8_OSTLU|nr:predicted protein [Ostreococcus lucimarinus CCE9901]ABO98760.1 predicted protein [Ostreococcus lucimarinus CCE9901]|eukprot:XP_001420467.1 predicted protein [Ostreococcus lucimarinus CCE9901]
MAMDIMDTPEPMATPVPTSPVRARMDSETYTDCVPGILLLCVRSLHQARRSIASVVRSLAPAFAPAFAPIFISPSNPRRVRSTRARLVDRFARVLARAFDVDENVSPNPRARDRDEDSRRVAPRRVAHPPRDATDPSRESRGVARCRPSRARARIPHLNCDETMKR